MQCIISMRAKTMQTHQNDADSERTHNARRVRARARWGGDLLIDSWPHGSNLEPIKILSGHSRNGKDQTDGAISAAHTALNESNSYC